MLTLPLSLYEKIKKQDSRAFAYLQEKIFPFIRRYILDHQGNHDDAVDIFQEGIITLWKNIDEGKFENTEDKKLINYLITICKYKWLDKIKSARAKYTKPLSPEWDGNAELNSDDWIHDENEVDDQMKLFQKLDENCRSLLIRFYVEEQSMKEIATNMNWTDETAKNNKYRCMEKMKTIIKNHHGK